ncbi:MAG: Bcr/CflA family drug resistance efflux transporter, partial [Rhizobiales bacterium]|nr:Bcr/CflA family drug resistance efflux transporter [Hyphomicrobiales bacterium]
VSEIVLGLTPDVYGLYFILVALGYSVGNFVSGRFAARLGMFKMILLGNILGLAAVVLMAVLFATVALHPLLLFGPMFILSLSNGLVLPSAMAGTVSVRPDLAGSAAGLSGSLQMVAGASLSYIVGVLLPLSQTPSAWPLIIAMACSLFVALGFGFWLYFGAKQDT